MSNKEYYVLTYNAGVDKTPRKHVFETAQEAIELAYYYIRHWYIYSDISITSQVKEIEATENEVDKSVAKKPNENCDDYECPNCLEYVFTEQDDGYTKPNYCSNCGQHLDWGDDE